MTPQTLNALIRKAAAAVAGDADPPDSEPRSVPADRPGHCRTALPMRMADRAGMSPREIARRMGAELRAYPGIAAVGIDGPGMLTITLTSQASTAMVRTIDASCLISDAQAGTLITPPPGGPALHGAGSMSITQARARVRDEARFRLLSAAGAHTMGKEGAARAPGALEDGTPAQDWSDRYLYRPPQRSEAGRLLSAIGAAAARFAFCRSVSDSVRPGEETGPELPALPSAGNPGAWARQRYTNPAFAVRYAHAHACSIHVWGAALGYGPSGAWGYSPGARAALEEPAARALRRGLFDATGVVGAAARRRAPHMVLRYLEGLAGTYHCWQESCRVLPGDGIDGDAAQRAAAAARIDLCLATAHVLRQGLALFGISAPARL